MTRAKQINPKHLLQAALIDQIKATQTPLAKGQGQVNSQQEFLRLMQEAGRRKLPHTELIKNHQALLGLRSFLSLGYFEMEPARGIHQYDGPHGNMFDEFNSRKPIEEQPYWMHKIIGLTSKQNNPILMTLPDEIEHLVFLQQLNLLKGASMYYLPRSIKNLSLSGLAVSFVSGVQMAAHTPKQVSSLLEMLDKAGLLMTREEFLKQNK